MSEAVFEFSASGMTPLPPQQLYPLPTLVSDSWLVTEGLTVSWEKHVERFFRSVLGETEIPRDTLKAFVHEVHARTPDAGRWFPRVEVVSHPEGHRLRYRHRRAPESQATAVLARAPHDPRTRPRVKGPDLEELLALRTAVAPSGATEAIIVDAQDRIVEGAYSTVMVWPAHTDRVCVIDPTLPRLPSVTEAVLVEIARTQGVEVGETLTSVDELQDAEVWVVSALHGVRLATAFIEGPGLNTDPERSARWRALWHQAARPPTLP